MARTEASTPGSGSAAGAAGGVLSGTYPNPGFAVDMATQAELDAVAAAKQPLDADLTSIAGLDSSTSGAIASDGAGWIKKTYAQFKTALSLVKADVGLGNVDNTADTAKPVSTAQQTAIDAKVEDTVTDGHTTVAPSGNAVFDALALKAPLASPTFTGTVTVPTPLNDTDASTKAYVDATAQGLSVKQSVRLATAAALPGVTVVGSTLVAVGVGVLTIDGQAVALNDRILVKDQVAQAQNGIYKCTTAGASLVAFVLTRATDSDTSAEIVGAFAFVEEGTANSNSGFVNTNTGTITIGTTAITYTQFSGAGEITAGAGLSKSGNTLSAIDAGVVTHAATGKTTPVDADEIPISDSAASNVLKKLTWANLKAGITTITGNAGTATALATARAIDGQNFDGTAAITVIAPGTHAATGKTSPIDADEIPLVDTAASNVLKKVTVANLRVVSQWSGTFDLVSSSSLTNIFSQSIPANTLGANGAILATVEGFYLNNSGASRGLTIAVQFGSTNVWFDASNATAFAASATNYPFFMQFLLANTGATNAQRVSGMIMIASPNAASTAGQGTLSTNSLVSTSFAGSSAIDTTAAANLIVRAQHSASNGSLELKGSVHYRAIA
jgi:hypothetical protein